MATRKDEKQQRRAARLEAERREKEAERRRLMLGYVIAGVLTLAVVVGLGIVLTRSSGDDNQVGGQDIPEAAHVQLQSGSTEGVAFDDREGTPPPALAQANLNKAAAAANCDLRLNLPDEGNTHVTAKTVNYKTNPPTSGNHNPTPQADGAYSEEPDPIHFVHSLEHGRIEIQYSPQLSEDDQLALKGVFDEDPAGMLLFPNSDMPYDVAVTAWTQMMGCKTYQGDATLDAIRDFRDIYRGQGPEAQVPINF
jgi:hypothetical protein